MFYMIEEMSFKCLLDVSFGQYCQEKLLETQSKVYGGAFFANIVNNFQLLTIFAKKALS